MAEHWHVHYRIIPGIHRILRACPVSVRTRGASPSTPTPRGNFNFHNHSPDVWRGKALNLKTCEHHNCKGTWSKFTNSLSQAWSCCPTSHTHCGYGERHEHSRASKFGHFRNIKTTQPCERGATHCKHCSRSNRVQYEM